MIMEKNNNTFRYVAGACFAIYAIVSIIRLVQIAPYNSPSAWWLLPILGAVLIAVAMFVTVPMLIAVGGGVSTISAARSFIICLGNEYNPWNYSIAAFLLLVVWVLIIVVGVNKKSGKILGMVAGALATLRFLIIIFGNIIDCGQFALDFVNFVCYAVIIVGVFMIGLASGDNAPKTSELTKANANGGVHATQAESQIDRLTKLKGLLDNGIISREEFETKKKQILGQ